MPAITICPLCRKSLLVPESLDRDVRVRCPLCSSEYVLGLVLADAVEVPLPSTNGDPSSSPVALPPEFVPVAHVAAVRENGDEPEPDEILAIDKPAGGSESAATPGTADRAGFDRQPADIATAADVPEETADASGESESPPADHDGFTLAPLEHATDEEGFTLGHPEHESPREGPPHGVSHLDFIPEADGGEAGPPVSRALTDWRAQQQKSRPSHALAKFVGVAVFGVLGVGLAYLAMSWANPAKFDYLHIWGPSKASSPSNGGPASHAPTEADKARWR
jgi:hypothetical protein